MPPNPAPLENDPRPYGPIGLVLSVVLIAALTLVLMLLGGALVFGVAAAVLGWREALGEVAALQSLMSTDSQALERVGVVSSIILYTAVSGAILIAARLRGGRGWRALIAWRPWHPFRASRFFWVLAASTIVYSIAADLLVARLYPPSQDWIKLPTGPLWISLFVLLAVIFAPITEELFFRGWLYTSLRLTPLGRWGTTLLTSVLFALAHWERTHIYALVVLPVGIALAVVRERTGSLKASMAFHALFNGAASLLLVAGF